MAHKIGVFCIRWVIAEKNAKDGYQTRWQIFQKRRISVQDIGYIFIKNEKSPFLSIGLQSGRSANILEWEWAVDIKATYGGVATLG